MLFRSQRDKLQTGIKSAMDEFKSHQSVPETLLSLSDMVKERGAWPSSVLCFLWLGLCNVHKTSSTNYLAAVKEFTTAAMTDKDSKFASQADIVPALERLISREAPDFLDENINAQQFLAELVATYVHAGTVTFKQVCPPLFILTSTSIRLQLL